MSRSLLAAATAAFALGACLPRAEIAPMSGPVPGLAPQPTPIQTQPQPQEVDVGLPNRPTRPSTTIRDTTGLLPGAEGTELAVLSTGPVQGADGRYDYAELGLGCRGGAPVMALNIPGRTLVSGGRWFSGGAEGRLDLTGAGGRVTGPAAVLAGLTARRVEIQALDAAGQVVAVQFDLSDIRAALSRLPC